MRHLRSLIGMGCIFIFFIVMGGLMIFFSVLARQDANRAEQLPVISGAALSNSQPGREAIIEGEISRTMRPVYENLVAYEYERLERDSDGDEEWVVRDQETPPLLVETSSGRARIEALSGASSYAIQQPAQTVYEGNERRYRGFSSGDAVMALGTAARDSEGINLDAEFVYGGTRDDYVETQRTTATVFFWIGIGTLLLDIVVFSIVALVRVVRG